MGNLSRNNHFVPQFYLENWGKDHKIWVMSLLVSHPNIPIWKIDSIKKTSVIRNLYVRSNGVSETDDFELWLNKEFESPVQNAFRKATNDERLTCQDWSLLINFTASMIMRTPARIVKESEKIKELLPKILDQFETKVSNMSPQELIIDMKKKSERSIDDSLLPIRTKVIDSIDCEKSVLEIDMHVGKAIHFLVIKHILTSTVKVLHLHQWKILNIADGMTWSTSDDPVMCVNYFADGKYDFDGGWGREGSEIIFPISPTKIIYTQVGRRNSIRGKLDIDKSLIIQEMIIKHAHRRINNFEKNSEIEIQRQRTVNKSMFDDEELQWVNFHIDHIEVEKKYLNRDLPA